MDYVFPNVPIIPRKTKIIFSFITLVQALSVGWIFTTLCYVAATWAGWQEKIEIVYLSDWLTLENAAVWASFSCTFLCVIQSRLNYPVGALAVTLLGILFWKQNLIGSFILQIYLLPILVYGWFRWRSDFNTRPVTYVSPPLLMWTAYIVLTGITFFAVLGILDAFGAKLPHMDAGILILSILAQWLLDNKKIETWAIWAMVNILSVIVYWQAGLYILCLQMAAFLFNTIWGYISWKRTMRHA